MPHFALGFADLKARIGTAVGDPLTCEFADSNGTGDVHQRTTTGLAFWRKSTNIPTFTNGSEHWAFASGGLVYWTGTPIDPTADAQLLDPASATQPSPAPAQTVPPTVVPSPQAPPPPTEADIAARVGPSVVQVITESGEGSGVRISAGIITNAHVVKDARQIQIATNDRRTAMATVVRIDVNADLALLQTELSLPALDTETASQQRQGDEILVLGYPLGLTDHGGQATLTRGLISATGIEAGTGRSLIQTDAAINHGNSGGAMVNMRGKLIGVPTFVIRDNGAQGVNFGVGSDTIAAFLAQPQSTVLPPPAALAFHGDPRSVALTISDFVGNWTPVTTDTSRIVDQGLYLESFIKDPSLYNEPGIMVGVKVFPTVDVAIANWPKESGPPDTTFVHSNVPGIGDASEAWSSSHNNMLFVECRLKNVILSVAEVTRENTNSVNYIEGLLQQMITRVNAQAR